MINVIITTPDFLPPDHDRLHRSEGTGLLLPFGNQLSVCCIKLPDPCRNVGDLGSGELLKLVEMEGVPHFGVSAIKSLCG